MPRDHKAATSVAQDLGDGAVGGFEQPPVARPEDLSKLPAGPLRRSLACQLAQTASTAGDVVNAPAFRKLAAGDPLLVLTLGQPRLSASLGSDEQLRLSARGTGQVLVLPRCDAGK